jgi:hypothetical protein
MKTKKRDLKVRIKELQQSIKEKCIDCCCFQVTEVIHCEITDCPLYKDRPLSRIGLQGLAAKLRKAEAKHRGLRAKMAS